jgi:hypothetical protein
MLLWHVTLLPAAVIALSVLHILLVRARGVAPPFGIDPATGEAVGFSDRADAATPVPVVVVVPADDPAPSTGVPSTGVPSTGVPSTGVPSPGIPVGRAPAP